MLLHNLYMKANVIFDNEFIFQANICLFVTYYRPWPYSYSYILLLHIVACSAPGVRLHIA